MIAMINQGIPIDECNISLCSKTALR